MQHLDAIRSHLKATEKSEADLVGWIRNGNVLGIEVVSDALDDARVAACMASELLAAVEAVLALHKRVGWDNGDCCFDCSDHLGDPILYPCPTVTAIRTALGEERQ